MKRMFIFFVAINFLLVGFSAVAAAPDPSVPNGKSLYSSRPARQAKIWTEETPVMAPVPIPGQNYVQPMMPSPFMVRDEPVLAPPVPMPPAPMPTPSNKLKQSTLEFSDMSFDQLSPPQNSNPVPQSTSQRPLSVISIEQKPNETKPQPAPTLAPPIVSTPKLVQTEVRTESREDKTDDIDSFNARLAKIQLEKHNLAETLRLIEKIKSASFKVKTLVDLAEYVSRDNNYKKEAEQLYSLAIDGIDALVKGNAIVVKMKDEPKFETVPSSPAVVPKAPSTTVFSNEPKKNEEPTSIPRKPALTLVEEDTPTPPTPKVEPIPTPAPTTKKSVIVLDDEPTKKETLSEKINDIKKEVTPLPPLTLPKPSLTDETSENAMGKATEKPVEKTELKALPGKRPSIFLNDESSDADKGSEVKTTELVKEPVKTEPAPSPIATESPSKTEPNLAPPEPATPKQQRRPMPGKKVTLEEN